MSFLDNITIYQTAAVMAVFLLVGVPLMAAGFKALGEWLYRKMRGRL